MGVLGQRKVVEPDNRNFAGHRDIAGLKGSKRPESDNVGCCENGIELYTLPNEALNRRQSGVPREMGGPDEIWIEINPGLCQSLLISCKPHLNLGKRCGSQEGPDLRFDDTGQHGCRPGRPDRRSA